jgi:hypothetical protein
MLEIAPAPSPWSLAPRVWNSTVARTVVANGRHSGDKIDQKE